LSTAQGVVRRLSAALPRGTLINTVGVGVLGLASYVHLAIAGHSLGPVQMANLSVIWSVVFSLGYGLFLPIEQEVTRVVAARRVAGRGSRPVWRRGFVLTWLIFGGLTVAFVIGTPVLADRLFGGSGALVAVTLGGLFGLAVASPVRGQAAGAGRFELYSGQLGLDGVLRIVLAVALGVAGSRSTAQFGLVLLVAPVLSTAVLLWPVRRTAAPGPATDHVELGRGVGPLIVTVLLGQFMLNSVIVSARLLAPEQSVLAAALLSALVLIRVPTLIFGAVQPSLLSSLAGLEHHDHHAFARQLRHAAALVTAMMACFAVPLVAIGPWLVRALFAAPDVLDRFDFLLLSLGTWAFLLAQALGVGVLALHRHRVQTLAWAAGALVLLAVTVLPAPVLIRLEWAYLAGNATVAIGLAAFLLLRREHPRREHPRAEQPHTEDPRTEQPRTEQPHREDPRTERPRRENLDWRRAEH
jgi:O-antigen/teichoic acid export membrane protein